MDFYILEINLFLIFVHAPGVVAINIFKSFFWPTKPTQNKSSIDNSTTLFFLTLLNYCNIKHVSFFRI